MVMQLSILTLTPRNVELLNFSKQTHSTIDLNAAESGMSAPGPTEPTNICPSCNEPSFHRGMHDNPPLYIASTRIPTRQFWHTAIRLQLRPNPPHLFSSVQLEARFLLKRLCIERKLARRGMQEAVEPLQHFGANFLQDKLFHLGWENGAFSDVTVKALGRQYPAHRILLCQSPFFEKLLSGPWRDARSPVVELMIDDPNIESDTVAYALQFLYGRPVEVNRRNVFGILAVGSFLGLEPLCEQCVAFMLADLNSDTFGEYYSFSHAYEYGEHAKVVREACLDYLRMHGLAQSKGVFQELSISDLQDLLLDDHLWVRSEIQRYYLAREITRAISAEREAGSDSDWMRVLESVFGLNGIRYEHFSLGDVEKVRREVRNDNGDRLAAVILPALDAGARRQSLIRKMVATQASLLKFSPLRFPLVSDTAACPAGSSLEEISPPRAFRIGVDFGSVSDVYKRKGLDSAEIFYGGSLWRLRLVQRRRSPMGESYIALFIHRRPASEFRFGYSDKRGDVHACLGVRVGWGPETVNRECEGRFNAENWDSYGWPQFMKQEKLEKCLEANGALRVVLRIGLKVGRDVS